jgi:hypothetical protein
VQRGTLPAALRAFIGNQERAQMADDLAPQLELTRLSDDSCKESLPGTSGFAETQAAELEGEIGPISLIEGRKHPR